MKFYFLPIACYLFSFSFESKAQNIKSGRTVDSQTFKPIAFVFVQSLRTKSFAMTNENGEFQLSCVIGDSLIISMLGYNRKRILIGTSNEPLLIMLSKTQTLLPEILIYGDLNPPGKERWSESIRIPKPYDNPTYKPGNDYTMQTFGPGYTIIGPFSYFLKSEKEKRKLKKVKEENRNTIVYRLVMSDPETKKAIMNHFNISEEKYESRIEQFAIDYPEMAYCKDKTELMDLLYYFFSKK